MRSLTQQTKPIETFANCETASNVAHLEEGRTGGSLSMVAATVNNNSLLSPRSPSRKDPHPIQQQQHQQLQRQQQGQQQQHSSSTVILVPAATTATTTGGMLHTREDGDQGSPWRGGRSSPRRGGRRPDGAGGSSSSRCNVLGGRPGRSGRTAATAPPRRSLC